MTIAITGATGHLGQLVIEKLKQKVDASEIVALVRTPAKAAGLGVATREADYTRQDTLDVALKGLIPCCLSPAMKSGNVRCSTKM